MGNQKQLNPYEAVRGIMQPVLSYVDKSQSLDTDYTRWHFMHFPFAVTTNAAGVVTGIIQPTHRTVPSTHKAFIRSIKGYLNYPVAAPEVAIGILFDLQEPGKVLRFFSDPFPMAVLVGGWSQTPSMMYARTGWMLDSNSDAMVTISTDTTVTFPATATTYRGGVWLECDLIPKQ
jgi:hypothetical protein